MSVAATAPLAPRRRRFVAVLGGLTAVNLIINVLALVTGPLQARLLGAQGRGELALVLAVNGFAAAIVCLGLGQFVAREINRTCDRGVLLGTVVVLSLGLGAIGAASAYPVSLLFGTNGEVRTLILAGLLILPIGVVGMNLHGAYWGEERWRLHSATRLLAPALTAVGYIVLAIAGAFTVVTAAVTAFAASVLALLPLWPLVRSTKNWGVDRVLGLRALWFGCKATLASLASLGSQRVDQLFIAGMVGARELGFYVVAGTLATATLLASQALNLIVVPMVAAGDHRSVRRILRITLAAMILGAMALAAASAPAIHLLFGSEFEASVEPARVLCFASVFTAGKGIVSSALVGHGRPGETAIVEIASFAGLVAMMLLVVPMYGATGAAVSVLLVTAAGLVALVLRARTWLGGRLADYLVPTAADVGWLTRSIRRRAARR